VWKAYAVSERAVIIDLTSLEFIAACGIRLIDDVRSPILPGNRCEWSSITRDRPCACCGLRA
jgi:hypothetical protein